MNKLSLQWRLTLLSSLLIAVCCIGLTMTLNHSAFRMADAIDAAIIQPALPADIPSSGETAISMASLSAATAEAKSLHLMDSVLYTILVVCIGGLLTYKVTGKALEPMRVLNEQVKNLNTHNLNESLEVPPTGDELAELTASFNDMTDKLAESFALQKRFSADAAHELRTPLAVMQTRLDVFRKKKEHTPEEYEALTGSLQKQVSRLRELVTELLNLANLEHQPKWETVSLSDLFRSICQELSETAAQKNVSFICSSSQLTVLGDSGLLYRALFNLVENAVKYNVAGGSVEIACEAKADHTIITIADTGIGIPDSVKHRIFEPFFRVDPSRSREMGGAGLGLAMVERIINQHQGRISLTDRPGGGSLFTVCLPKEP